MNFQEPDISAPILNLAALLKNPEPGLVSWHAACERVYQMVVRPERARIRQEWITEKRRRFCDRGCCVLFSSDDFDAALDRICPDEE